MYRYLFKNKFLFLLCTISIIIVSVLKISLAFLLQYIVDLAVSAEMSKFLNAIFFSLLFIILVIVCNYFTEKIVARFIQKCLIDLKSDIFNGILKRNIVSFNAKNSSLYISNLTNDINIVENDFFNSIRLLIENTSLFIFAFVAIIRINYLFIIFIFVIGIIPLLINKFFLTKIQVSRQSTSDNLGQFTTKIKEIFSGFEIIKTFNIENKIKDEFDINNCLVEKSRANTKILNSLVETLSFASGLLMSLSNMLLGVYLVTGNKITIGSMIATVQLMNYIVNPLTQITVLMNKIITTNKVYGSLLNNNETGSDDENDKCSKDCFESRIEFKNVAFSYDNQPEIIKEINFTIEKNKKYAIVGESGSGKSTLLRLIMKYYEDFKGDILIDNEDIRNISSLSWYKLISEIHQDVFLFNDTIERNICLYNDFDSDSLSRAVKESGLSGLVEALPGKLNTYISESGKNFSGGEKQRIAIARALIKNTPVLILDEATSSLDNKMSYEIEKLILQLENVTSLIITHKFVPELMSLYDEILVLKDGVIEEKGSFSELLDNKGYFYNLYSIGKVK